jgi:zinc and cadmium transporter
METFLTILSVLIVSSISLLGIFLLFVSEKRLKITVFVLISFAVGSLLGDVFFHLIPQVFGNTAMLRQSSILVLIGIMGFFLLEHFLHWRHSLLGEEGHSHAHPVGYVNIVSGGFHNFMDGMVIGASYLISIPLGVATTLAILFHEIPHELGDFGVLLHAGFSRRKALLYNFLSALLATIGGITALIIGTRFEGFSTDVAALTIGGFLYIAGSDLIPELHKDISTKKSFMQFLALLAGLGFMTLLTIFE